MFRLDEKMPEDQAKNMNVIVLAYLGDAVFSLYTREKLAFKGDFKANELHRLTSVEVKASAQADFIDRLLPVLTEDEIFLYKRGRNAKKGTKAKHASVAQYNKSTGFEALLGYLYVTGNYERLNYLLNYEGDGNNEALSSEDSYNEN